VKQPPAALARVGEAREGSVEPLLQVGDGAGAVCDAEAELGVVAGGDGGGRGVVRLVDCLVGERVLVEWVGG